jgi:hypothetical protein
MLGVELRQLVGERGERRGHACRVHPHVRVVAALFEPQEARGVRGQLPDRRVDVVERDRRLEAGAVGGD